MTGRIKYVDLVRKADGAHYPPFNELFQQLASARHSPEEWGKLLTWIAAGNAADPVSPLPREKLERRQRSGGEVVARKIRQSGPFGASFYSASQHPAENRQRFNFGPFWPLVIWFAAVAGVAIWMGRLKFEELQLPVGLSIGTAALLVLVLYTMVRAERGMPSAPIRYGDVVGMAILLVSVLTAMALYLARWQYQLPNGSLYSLLLIVSVTAVTFEATRTFCEWSESRSWHWPICFVMVLLALSAFAPVDRFVKPAWEQGSTQEQIQPLALSSGPANTQGS